MKKILFVIALWLIVSGCGGGTGEDYDDGPTGGFSVGEYSDEADASFGDDASTSLAPPRILADLRAFPGAEGFGTESPAGRGGKIIKVTNLNDSGAGSLRAAIEASGPRIVVFEVGGRIALRSDLEIRNPFITIAGQTAPFPGVQVTGARVTVQSHDVLIQHIRSRNGIADGASHSLRVISGSYNVVIDHCTFMWASDEVASIWTNDKPIYNVTLSNNIIAEGIGGSGKGTAIGAGTSLNNYSLGANIVDKVSVIKNLYANSVERFPMVSRDCNVMIANNLGYYSEWGFVELGVNNGPVKATVVGNHFVTGNRNQNSPSIWTMDISSGKHQVYVSDNVTSGSGVIPATFTDYDGGSVVNSPPIKDDTKLIAASQVKAYVLKNVGARPAERDSAEVRLINEVEREVGGFKFSVSEAGGWPAEYNYPTSRSFDSFIPYDPNGDDDGNGYTNIEEVLYELALEAEGRM
ncbi:hypothetical protein DESUT3_28770 [Desulfuromonas versatilis]|uniref:Pectate lyase n=1 Tax=Desulfuromonas versatilis TaxID=2802975 RepID=A0ABM8HZ61_9BACT|nr:hypothetical protein [Desulfuromonas versatilis]BCR05808.1 hypothetical protein DESUT3_28770 [Desulfuromonas versatilis]